MKNILKFVEKFKKNPNDEELLHNLRVMSRNNLSVLNHNFKTDIGLESLIKNSNNIRDYDVLILKCRYKSIKKILKNRREKKILKFLSFLNKFKTKIVENRDEDKKISKSRCLEYLNSDFLTLNDSELHKIRIFVKRCRYVYSEKNKHEKFVKYLKKLQTLLGESRDYYNCIKIIKKFNFDYEFEEKRKLELLKEAEEVRKKFIKEFI